MCYRLLCGDKQTLDEEERGNLSWRILSIKLACVHLYVTNIYIFDIEEFSPLCVVSFPRQEGLGYRGYVAEHEPERKPTVISLLFLLQALAFASSLASLGDEL